MPLCECVSPYIHVTRTHAVADKTHVNYYHSDKKGMLIEKIESNWRKALTYISYIIIYVMIAKYTHKYVELVYFVLFFARACQAAAFSFPFSMRTKMTKKYIDLNVKITLTQTYTYIHVCRRQWWWMYICKDNYKKL